MPGSGWGRGAAFVSGLSRSLEQAGRRFLHGEPSQGCGPRVPVSWGDSGEVPQHGRMCWVPGREMCCDKDNSQPPKFQRGALLTNKSIKNAQSHWAEHQGP